ncbi:hypothetical protein Tco_0788996 [Tanacetum coccineum]
MLAATACRIQPRRALPHSLLRIRDSLSASVAEVPSASALQVLRRLGSIFTSVYAAKLKSVVSLLEGLQGRKKTALCQKE